LCHDGFPLLGRKKTALLRLVAPDVGSNEKARTRRALSVVGVRYLGEKTLKFWVDE